MGKNFHLCFAMAAELLAELQRQNLSENCTWFQSKDVRKAILMYDDVTSCRFSNMLLSMAKKNETWNPAVVFSEIRENFILLADVLDCVQQKYDTWKVEETQQRIIHYSVSKLLRKL